MTSALAQQLRKVSLAIGGAPGARRDAHASLLYSAKEAADTDTQTVFTNAVIGKRSFLQSLSDLETKVRTLKVPQACTMATTEKYFRCTSLGEGDPEIQGPEQPHKKLSNAKSFT